MRAPSLAAVDAQFDALFAGSVLPPIAAPVPRAHEFTEDGICRHCGFDGGEFHHWKHMTHEGKASDYTGPPCA